VEDPAEAPSAPVSAAVAAPDVGAPADAPTSTPGDTAAEAPGQARATPVRIEPTPGRWPVSAPPADGRDKRRYALLGAAIVVLLGLGGWVLTLAHGSVKDVPEVIAPSPPKVKLAYQPGDGTTPISPITPVSVTATDGELRNVVLTAGGGTPVKGELSPDRRTWTVSQPLAYGKTYTWTGTAADDLNKTVPLAGMVTTVKPRKIVRGTINIGDGRVVGIAAPIELQFSGHVTDRAAAERALKVDTSVPTVGSWAWFQDERGGSRVRWRPQAYWQPGTKVTVTAPMFGVDYGAGAWGASNISSSFTIGRAQITKADVNSHQLVVLRDGRQVFNFPASYGLGSDPNRNTRNGIHVVSEKFTDKRMVNPQYHYDVMEHFAVRISNNGEFIHANPETTGVQGEANVSHGCVNLSTADAKAYFDSVLYGDPVEVTGSPVPLSARDGDIWVWTMDWPAWQKLSALHREG
jgi:lipoprotein-anchoring transpeptidase ErfK/SrfK